MRAFSVLSEPASQLAITGKPRAIGIDFGTTNSVVALVGQDGAVTARQFLTPAGLVDAYRSALLYYRVGRPPHATITHVSGPEALDRALDVSGEHRFLQSLKTHLSSRAFQETRLFGKRFTLEDLIGTFLADIVPDAAALEGVPVVSGRPVVFAGDRPDEALAEARLAGAYAQAGLPHVTFAYEPLGAAYWYASKLQKPETVLVADFGGGTSDFSILRFSRQNGRISAEPLAHAGVGIAGDVFDYRILDNIVAPRLGKGTRYRSFKKWLPLPAHYHTAFAQWHRLSLLKSPETLAELKRLLRDAEEPDRLEDLITVIENDLGYELYRAVSTVKVALSGADIAPFRFEQAGLSIFGDVRRSAFERWIADDVASIGAAVDEALLRAGLSPAEVDIVFMTGGTSLVPAVRREFETRFGASKLHFGDAFRSVASGLALVALERQHA